MSESNTVLSFSQLGVAANKRKALARSEQYRWVAEQLVSPTVSIRQIARVMNERRIMTPSGKGQWSPGMISVLLDRLELKEQLTIKVA